jgi:hypothetical protein
MAESGVRSKEVASAAPMGQKYTGGEYIQMPFIYKEMKAKMAF